MISLTAVANERPLEGILRYITAEHSFIFEPTSPADVQARSGLSGVTSLSVGTLQIEIGVDTRLVLFVWGLHPRTTWNMQPIGRPNPEKASVSVEMQVPLLRGVTVPIAPVGAWATSFDEITGWVRVARDANFASERELLVASGITLGLTNGGLDSLWLHPVFE